MTLLVKVKNKHIHICNVAFINVKSKVIITIVCRSIVIVSANVFDFGKYLLLSLFFAGEAEAGLSVAPSDTPL